MKGREEGKEEGRKGGREGGGREGRYLGREADVDQEELSGARGDGLAPDGRTLVERLEVEPGVGGREGGREGGKEGRRDGGTEGRRENGWMGGGEGETDGGREGQREGGREGVVMDLKLFTFRLKNGNNWPSSPSLPPSLPFSFSPSLPPYR